MAENVLDVNENVCGMTRLALKTLENFALESKLPPLRNKKLSQLYLWNTSGCTVKHTNKANERMEKFKLKGSNEAAVRPSTKPAMSTNTHPASDDCQKNKPTTQSFKSRQGAKQAVYRWVVSASGWTQIMVKSAQVPTQDPLSGKSGGNNFKWEHSIQKAKEFREKWAPKPPAAPQPGTCCCSTEKTVLCRVCGYFARGSINRLCPLHPNKIYLYNRFQHCPERTCLAPKVYLQEYD